MKQSNKNSNHLCLCGRAWKIIGRGLDSQPECHKRIIHFKFLCVSQSPLIFPLLFASIISYLNNCNSYMLPFMPLQSFHIRGIYSKYLHDVTPIPKRLIAPHCIWHE